jgi:hypothetical protein
MKSTKIEARFSPGKGFSLQATTDEPNGSLLIQVGFWAAAVLAVLEVLYLGLLAVMMLTGTFSFPPPLPFQLVAGVITLLAAPLLVVLAACIHDAAPLEKKILSQIGLAFTSLGALVISINRFVQLSVIRQSLLSGVTDGLARFLPYDGGSVMFALEMMGWGFLLGLGALFFAPVFGGDRLGNWLSRLWIAYGVLALASALGFILSVPVLTMLGFAAWGPILCAIAILFAIQFRRLKEN